MAYFAGGQHESCSNVLFNDASCHVSIALNPSYIRFCLTLSCGRKRYLAHTHVLDLYVKQPQSHAGKSSGASRVINVASVSI